MRAPSLFVPGDSLVHRADPLTKAVWALATALAGFVVPDWPGALVLLLVNLVLVASARLVRRLIALFAISAVAVLIVFVAQGLTFPGNLHPAFTVAGFTFYREGLGYAAFLWLRIWNMIAAMGILVLTARPQDFVTSLLMRGLPVRAGYAMAAVLQIVPVLGGALNTIMDAQRSRGVETEGSLVRRFRALLPVLGPLVMSAFTAAQDRAVALDVRGFSRVGAKTIFRPVADMTGARLVRGGAVLILVVALLWRLGAPGWLGWSG